MTEPEFFERISDAARRLAQSGNNPPFYARCNPGDMESVARDCGAVIRDGEVDVLTASGRVHAWAAPGVQPGSIDVSTYGRGLPDLYARAGDILRRQFAVSAELSAQSVYQERDAWSRSGAESAGISREQANAAPALSPAWFAQREEERRRFRSMPRDLVPSRDAAVPKTTGCNVCGGTLYFSARQRGDGLCNPCSRLDSQPAAPTAPADPLDAVIDGVTLRYLLEVDRDNRAETPHLCMFQLSQAQRAAVSAHWSAELRAKVAASKERERTRVVVDMEDE